MKKLLTYLILLTCFESFVSSAPCYCCNHKNLSGTADSDVSAKKEVLPQDEVDMDIHPLSIFSLRYF